MFNKLKKLNNRAKKRKCDTAQRVFLQEMHYHKITVKEVKHEVVRS